jgi:hypothetical protein
MGSVKGKTVICIYIYISVCVCVFIYIVYIYIQTGAMLYRSYTNISGRSRLTPVTYSANYKTTVSAI